MAITACRHEGPSPTRKTHEKLKGGVANQRNDPKYFQKCELEQGLTNLSQNGYGKFYYINGAIEEGVGLGLFEFQF